MRKYQKYKPSGVEWIGEIPDSWSIIRLKYAASFNDDSLDENTDPETIISYVDISSVEYPEGIKNPEEYQFANAPSRARRKVKEGDTIVSTVRTYLRAIATIKKKHQGLIVSTGFAVIRPQNIKADYLSNIIESEGFIGEIIAESKGVSYPAINPSEIMNLSIPLPPSDEQQHIAQYIALKSSHIDTLLLKKQQLIELLKEERAAIINKAVTKGIDPNVRMKDSGVEWLGEIPAHWEVTRLKYLGEIKYGLGQPPKQIENGLPLIRATNVERGRINIKDLIFVDPEDIPYDRDPVLRENDIIVVRSGAYTGDSAIIPKEFDGSITGYDMVFRPKDVVPKFAAFALLSNYVLNSQLIPESLRAAQPHLNKEELGETIFATPSLKEQKSISVYLIAETMRIDLLKEKTEQEIELLKKYRTALISEVVTGKICVI